MMPRPHGGKLIDRCLTDSEKEKIMEQINELQKIELRDDLVNDVENIAYGVFSPLKGFLNQEDFEHVLLEKRLANDLPWTIPIIMDISEVKSKEIKENDEIILHDNRGLLAVMQVEEKYGYSKHDLAQHIFGTTDINHPGVAKVFELNEVLIGGKIGLINKTERQYEKYNLSPLETRILFKEKGWRTVVGFQTRNPPHIGHEYVQKTALTFVDGVFINPVIGKKKVGDFRDDVILAAYDELIKHYYLKERAVMSILNFDMRYAGPREAVFHAIVRKNFGCSHIIIGRDHAGVGNYYDPYAAQDIFEDFPDLGIFPIFFKAFFYCKRCGGVANEKTCPHDEKDHITFSGTKIRNLICEKKLPPEEIMRPEVSKLIISYTDSDSCFVSD
ncbi:MAG: sulfate adenylyltransferase [Promethearchaeota archaeon]